MSSDKTEGGAKVDEREYLRTISDIREWLVRIDANQTHQTKLLETINQQATNAFAKADSAEDTANEALKLAEKTEKRLNEREKDEKVHRRWVIGTIVTIVLFLLPMVSAYYGG